MKLKSLTIALGTLGMVVLVPMVKVAIAQTAPADALPIWEYDPVAAEMCDRVSLRGEFQTLNPQLSNYTETTRVWA